MIDVTVLIAAALVAAILYGLSDRFNRFCKYVRRVNKIPGPTFGIPFFGVACALLRIPKEDRIDWFKNIGNQYKDGFIRTWLGFGATVHVRKPEFAEVILRSNTQITKSVMYDYLTPWLGQGLLTSTGTQWFHNRKLITPAFHFSILEDFSEVMIEKATILNDCIERKIKTGGGKPFDIFELAVRCALDIICETAMGTNVHAQEAVESEYINSVHAISTGAVNRFIRPWLKFDWLYYRTSLGKSYKAAVATAHDLCTRVIKTKLEERESGEHNVETAGKSKKKAFLDLLLEANEKENNPLTLEEIRDQTNTFMFAGHDTTGALISWTLFCLGNELDVQEKVHEELDDILGDSNDHDTLKQLPNLKYLERVIKEVLRLYGSVTVISRKLVDDLEIGGYTVPSGTTLAIQMYQIHTNPEVWADPMRFDPDRFLPENAKGRHPYAYVPFSAGPRNCIGQKFAMLEAKIVLAQVLRKFSVKSIDNHKTMKKYSDIILKPMNGIFVNMTKRSSDVQ